MSPVLHLRYIRVVAVPRWAGVSPLHHPVFVREEGLTDRSMGGAGRQIDWEWCSSRLGATSGSEGAVI